MADDKIKSLFIRTDTQNFTLNINEIFKIHFTDFLDNLRSYVNLEKNKTNFTNNLIDASFKGSPILGGFPIEATPQESRCHAFYRYVGFPIVSKDKEIYNPGIYIPDDINLQFLEFSDKAKIAKNPLPGFNELSDLREREPNKWAKIFSNGASTSAGVHALSLVNTRDLASSFKEPVNVANYFTDKESFNKKNQSYKIDDDGKVGGNDVKFSEYVNAEGDELGPLYFEPNRSHIITPFIVDARIEILSQKNILIPFVDPDKNIPDSYRPLLEYIILERITSENNKDTTSNLAGLSVTKAIEDIKKIEAIQDQQILKDISSGNIYKTSQQQSFIYYFNIINNMMTQLAAAKKIVETVQSEYYYLPIVNSGGPENGCTVRSPFLSIFYSDEETPNEQLQTEADKLVVKSLLKNKFNKINAQFNTLKNTSLPNLAKTSANYFPLVFNRLASTTDQTGDILEKDLLNISQRRKHKLSVANNALKTIEIITGEFSGFGLCDMVAIIGGLYLMSSNNLLGFLDPDSYNSATNHELLEDLLPDNNPSTIEMALDDLNKNVKIFYDIMDALLEELD